MVGLALARWRARRRARWPGSRARFEASVVHQGRDIAPLMYNTPPAWATAEAIEELVSAPAQRNEHTDLSLAQHAAQYLAARKVKPYQHVIVDESQDLHEA